MEEFKFCIFFVAEKLWCLLCGFSFSVWCTSGWALWGSDENECHKFYGIILCVVIKFSYISLFCESQGNGWQYICCRFLFSSLYKNSLDLIVLLSHNFSAELPHKWGTYHFSVNRSNLSCIMSCHVTTVFTLQSSLNLRLPRFLPQYWEQMINHLVTNLLGIFTVSSGSWVRNFGPLQLTFLLPCILCLHKEAEWRS
jgi:hypothetical protein